MQVGTLGNLLLLVLVLQLPVWADNEGAHERTVTGVGDDQRLAILDGLLQAIEMVNGVKIEHKSVTYRRYADVLEDLKESFKSSVVGTSEIKTASRGLIESYTASDPQTSGRRCQVRMTVRVLVYDPKSPIRAGQRKVIAVLPFRAAKQNYSVYDANLAPSKFMPTLSQGLVKGLVQSRKFTVLDREFLSELMGEQALIQAANSPPAEQLRIGQQLGADFLLVGSLDDADATSSTKLVRLTNRQVTSRSAKAAVAYRILNVATGKVHWADTYRHTYGEDELKNLDPARAGLRIEELLMEDAAAMIADQVITGVFPIRVLKITGDEVVLNQGGLRTAEGEEFEVFNQGEELIDPDTNEPLERVESVVARVRITRLTTKLAYGKVIAGDASKITPEHAICRRAAPPPSQQAAQ
jgi:curli biogenesis system outer membrane secretion channel CsgG